MIASDEWAQEKLHDLASAVEVEHSAGHVAATVAAAKKRRVRVIALKATVGVTGVAAALIVVAASYTLSNSPDGSTANDYAATTTPSDPVDSSQGPAEPPRDLLPLYSRAAGLVDDHEELFGAYWYDDATQTVFLSVISQAAETLARTETGSDARIEYVHAKHSHLQVMQALREATSSGALFYDAVTMLSVAPHGDRGIVTLSRELGPQEADAFKHAQEQSPVPLSSRVAPEGALVMGPIDDTVLD